MQRLYPFCLLILFILWPCLGQAEIEVPSSETINLFSFETPQEAWPEVATEHYCIAGSVGIPG